MRCNRVLALNIQTCATVFLASFLASALAANAIADDDPSPSTTKAPAPVAAGQAPTAPVVLPIPTAADETPSAPVVLPTPVAPRATPNSPTAEPGTGGVAAYPPLGSPGSPVNEILRQGNEAAMVTDLVTRAIAEEEAKANQVEHLSANLTNPSAPLRVQLQVGNLGDTLLFLAVCTGVIVFTAVVTAVCTLGAMYAGSRWFACRRNRSGMAEPVR